MKTVKRSARILRLAALALLGGAAWSAGEEVPPPAGPGRPPGPPGPREGGRGPSGPPPLEVWKKADVDGSGGISAAEFAGMERPGKLPDEVREKIFARLDKDDSGEIERREWPVDKRGDGRFQRMRELDKDGSGGVSLDEFRQSSWVARMPEERQRALFQRMDTNGDGQLDRSDRPERRRRGPRDERKGGPGEGFGQLDRNDDGFVDFEEFRRSPRVRGLDEDAQEDRFEALDRNGDLKLDRGELQPAPPEGGRGPRKPDGRQGPGEGKPPVD